MLRFIDASGPGITRKKMRLGWGYFTPEGERLKDRDEIERLNKLAMPPAYERCWFCPDPAGHLQGYGFDARGRKQYRYHAEYRAQQDSLKYEKLADFGRALGKLRAKIDEDVQGKTPSRDTVVAAVVRLIDETHIRVGNEEYARDNASYGATTLRNRHAKVEGGKLKLSYVGKHGIKRTVTVTDKNLARIAKRTQDLPGQHLFEFIGADGEVHPVTSTEVNAYIKEATGGEFTAKDFRTWGATVIAFEELIKRAGEAGRATVHLKAVVEPVAEALGNTAAMSRKSYIHPAIIDAAKNAGAFDPGKLPRTGKWLSATERGLIEFLDALPAAEAHVEEAVEAKQAAGETPAQAKAEVVQEAGA